MSDGWFNRALECLDAGKPGRALEWLAACCASRPSDASARRALALVWAQLGRLAEARDALQQAVELDPDAAEIPIIRRALRDAGRRRFGPGRRHVRRRGSRHGRTWCREL
jgi:tetratricopeptide (TPR) repeat protein